MTDDGEKITFVDLMAVKNWFRDNTPRPVGETMQRIPSQTLSGEIKLAKVTRRADNLEPIGLSERMICLRDIMNKK